MCIDGDLCEKPWRPGSRVSLARACWRTEIQDHSPPLPPRADTCDCRSLLLLKLRVPRKRGYFLKESGLKDRHCYGFKNLLPEFEVSGPASFANQNEGLGSYRSLCDERVIRCRQSCA